MKAFAISLMLAPWLSASPVSNPPAQMDQPTFRAPARPWVSVEQAERERECRDRVEQARAAAGKPELDRTPASPDKPTLMYAVDHRIDDCGVIVPVSDPSDLRQSPEPSNPAIIPAGPDQ